MLRQDDGDIHLCVSSTILSYASQVLEALLAPEKFAEGSTPRSAEEPKKITLPDDNCTAVVDLCALLHHDRQSDLMELRPGSEDCDIQEGSYRLMELSVLVDKYHCGASAHFMLEALFSRFSKAPCKGATTLCNLAAAAYVVRSRDLFTEFTRDLVLTSTDPFLLCQKARCGQLLGLCGPCGCSSISSHIIAH